MEMGVFKSRHHCVSVVHTLDNFIIMYPHKLYIYQNLGHEDNNVTNLNASFSFSKLPRHVNLPVDKKGNMWSDVIFGVNPGRIWNYFASL